MALENKVFIFLIIFVSVFSPYECCIRTLVDSERRIFGARNKTHDLNFRNRHPIETPLYDGDSVAEFLSFCQGHTIPTEQEMTDNEKRITKTPCPHPNGYRLLRQIELFYLDEAQDKFRRQQLQLTSSFRATFSVILFLIPLSMTIYLVIKKHFYIGHLHLPLPYWDRLFPPRDDLTEGVKYELYVWMKFLALPGNHPIVRSKDPNTMVWYKHDKSSEDVDPKTINIKRGFTRFKFRDRKDPVKLITDDELRVKKKNILKVGWDFVGDRNINAFEDKEFSPIEKATNLTTTNEAESEDRNAKHFLSFKTLGKLVKSLEHEHEHQQ